jgi:hypothetical protein
MMPPSWPVLGRGWRTTLGRLWILDGEFLSFSHYMATFLNAGLCNVMARSRWDLCYSRLCLAAPHGRWWVLDGELHFFTTIWHTLLYFWMLFLTQCLSKLDIFAVPSKYGNKSCNKGWTNANHRPNTRNKMSSGTFTSCTCLRSLPTWTRLLVLMTLFCPISIWRGWVHFKSV